MCIATLTVLIDISIKFYTSLLGLLSLYTSDFFIFLFIHNVSRISVVNLYEMKEMKK